MSVNLAITQRCNEYCPHCFVDAGRKKADTSVELGLEDWISIVKECREHDYEHIHIFGGEPFLVSFLSDLCDKIDDLGLSYNIATNGLAVKPSEYGWLQNSGGSLVVSIFGNEEFHDQFTHTPQSFTRAKETIRTSLARGVDASVATCLLRGNIAQYPELIQKFAKIGVRDFYALHFSPVGRGEQIVEETLEPATWHSLYLRLKQLLPIIRQEVGHQVEVLFELANYPTENLSNLHFTQEVMSCPLPRHPNLTIDWAGRVFPCILFLNNPRWALGILHNTPLGTTLKELNLGWFNERVKQNQCPACKYYWKCQGGCPAYTLGMLKDFRCSDLKFLPFCPLRVIPI